MTLAALFLTAALPLPAVEKADYLSYNGFTIPAEPVLPAKETHPSIWFKASDLEALRAKKGADDYARKLWEHLAAHRLLSIELPPEPTSKDDTKGLHQYYGEISTLAKVNALMSLLGPEAERGKYADRAIQALRRAYDGPLYELDPKVQGSAGDEIYRAVWAQSYAAAYDWVQPRLSAEDDAAIRARLIREAQLIADNLHHWTPRPHNHLSKPAWGLASLALTLSDAPNARQWLAIALDASNQNTRYFFSADGVHREGAHYLVFSAINFVPFLYHYRNISGVDAFTAFQPVFETVVATRNSRGWLPNIYDSYLRPYPSHMVAAPYAGRKTWLNPGADLAQVLQWSYRTTDMGPFAESLAKTGFDYTGASWDYEIEVDEFLTYAPEIPATAPSHDPTVFLAGGQTVFRSAWTSPGSGEGQRYLLFHGVAQADNHFHLDHLSFVMQAEGQLMASDSGYSRKSYGEAIRKEWYMTPAAHNVVTADGEAPVDVKENVTPLSRDQLSSRVFQMEEKEAPYPNGGQQQRAITFVANDYFVVIDHLKSPKDAAFRLHLHGGRGQMELEGNRATWAFEKDSYGPAAKLATWTLPAGAAMTQAEGEVTYIKGDYAKFGYLTADQKGTGAAFLQFLFPLPASAESPGFRDLSNDSRLAAVVTKDGAEDTVIARLGEATSELSAGPVSADAKFAWVRQKPSQPVQWALQQGRRLSLAGQPVFTASEPLTVAGNGPELTLSGPKAGYTVTVAHDGPALFNGKPVTGKSAGGVTTFELSGEGVLVLR
jgi:hypothetical protein